MTFLVGDSREGAALSMAMGAGVACPWNPVLLHPTLVVVVQQDSGFYGALRTLTALCQQVPSCIYTRCFACLPLNNVLETWLLAAGYLQQKGVSGSTRTVYEEACSEMDTINRYNPIHGMSRLCSG